MGCNIHAYVEARKIGEEKWSLVEPMGRDKNGYGSKHDDQAPDSAHDIECHWHRNYFLYAILANVRNYHGDVKCIDEPKGPPTDMSDQYREILHYEDKEGNLLFDTDYHSHSYHDLETLINEIDWGYRDPNDSNKFRDLRYYCSDFFGEVINPMRAIESLKEDGRQIYETRCVFHFDN